MKQNKFKRYEDISNNIKKIIDINVINFLNEQELLAKYIKYNSKSIENGFTLLDIEKIKNILGYIAKKMGEIKKAVLMKLLWYIDMLSYKDTGHAITGLIYQHMPYGALPIGHREIVELSSIKSKLFINDREYEEYRIEFNNDYKIKKILKEEKDIIDKVINKFKNYKSFEISEYMHKEKAYIETKENQIIPFTFANQINKF